MPEETCESPGHTLGRQCTSDDVCSDGCFCNGFERCRAGLCQAGADPCVDRLECTRHQCVERADRCFVLPDHALCQNGDACDGREVCDVVTGCEPVSPLDCNDNDACTFDSCEPEQGCVHTPRDLDGDGFVAKTCGGEDCDDTPGLGEQVYPGAVEQCSNRRDDDCDGLRDYADSTECQPTNDTCATAQPLSGSGVYSGSTRGLGADVDLSCRARGADAVFELALDEPRDVRISLSGLDPGAGISLRRWADCGSASELTCSATVPPILLRRGVPAGRYAIVVQSDDPEAFDLVVQLSEPTSAPPVNVCDGGTRDVSQGGTFGGLFAEVEDVYRSGCFPGDPARDVAHRLVLDGESDVTLTAASRGGAIVPSTRLALVRDCADAAAAVQCAWAPEAVLRRRGLAPGTYYILLESESDEAAQWTLDVEITPPEPRTVGDTCAEPIEVGGGPGSVVWGQMEHDSGASCGQGVAFRDAFFAFELTSVQDVRLETTSAGFHVVALSRECGSVAAELRCAAQVSPIVQTWRSLPAGRYYVTLAATDSSGTGTVQVTRSAPTPVPANDRCSGAIALESGVGRTDTLSGFEDDVLGCYGAGRPDAVYRITLDTRSTLDVIVNPGSLRGEALLTLADGCGPVAPLACDASTAAAVVSQVLDAGTYYVLVEASDPSAVGDYDIRALVTPQ